MKISVVGGGNAGVFTALLFAFQGKEVELIYNPDIVPERVGQATLIDPPRMLWNALGFNWYNNPIHATFKSGILYEGWGNINDKIFHDFPADTLAMHYCPWEMQKYILNSGLFNVVEEDKDPKDIDADLVFDCRGKPDDYSNYEDLVNPINACLLARPNWDTSKTFWSRHVATPDGWTFIIPTHPSSPSNDYCVGYCYNKDITSKENAEKNFLCMFDVELQHHVEFKNYVAKNPVVDDRIILNGNRLFFLEPLEASSTQTYVEVARYVLNYGIEGLPNKVHQYIIQNQKFILWHYQSGSKYNTSFWNYAQSLSFDDEVFDMWLEKSKKSLMYDIMKVVNSDPLCKYGQWTPYAFKVWHNGITREEKC